MNYLRKILEIFSYNFKKKIPILFVILAISLFLETLGLGILIPYFTILLETDISLTYPEAKPVLDWFGNPDQETLTIYGIFAIVIFFLMKSFFQLYANWKLIKFVTDLTADLKNRLFSIYVANTYSFHTKNNSSDLSKNIQLEITQFVILIQSILQLFLEITVVFAALIVAALIEPLGVAVSAIIIGGFIFGVGKLLKSKILKLGEERIKADADTNKIILESLNAIKEIKIYGKELFFLNHLKSKTYLKAELTSVYNFLNMIPRSFIEFIAVFSLAFIVYISIYSGTNPSDIVLLIGVFAVAAFKLIPSANKINTYRNQILFNISSVNELYSEFKLKLNSIELTENNFKLKFRDSINLKNIKFKYSENSKYIFNNINLSIKRGNIIGIIGESGSGKSTIIDIILGLFKPNSGEVEVDGLDINNNLREWQNSIGYVPQVINLIDDTLRNNIVLGLKPEMIDDKKINEAIKLAFLKDFVNNLPDGLDTEVGEKGVRLSGGQRQRIGIARALYNNPDVIVLDEATSALDTKTEKDVMKSIDNLIGLKTIIIVSHRISTLDNCHEIYRVENGLISKVLKK